VVWLNCGAENCIGPRALTRVFGPCDLSLPHIVLARFFRFGPIAYLGTISYGIYLYHIPAMAILRSAGEKLGIEEWSVLYVVIYLVGLTAVSAISFQYFEKPILSQRRRFLRSTTGRDLDKA